MARRHTAERREVAPDLRYNSKLIGRLINYVMIRGKKSVAEAVTYGMLDFIKEQSKEDPLEVLMRAMDNIRPKVEVKSRRVGGATYQVPIEVRTDRGMSLAIRWLIAAARARKGKTMRERLATELAEAFQGQGNAIKKRDDTHKMAQANKAFAHYKW